MAELTQKELLQPSLLDRLEDDEPHKKRSEARDKRIFSFRRLKKSVLRDIGWLLNTGSLETSRDLQAYPEVGRSVLNFGIPDLTGSYASNVDGEALEEFIRQAIINFEPRIITESFSIRWLPPEEYDPQRDRIDNLHPNTIAFEIECKLWAVPAPERLYLRTVLDLELGDFYVLEN